MKFYPCMGTLLTKPGSQGIHNQDGASRTRGLPSWSTCAATLTMPALKAFHLALRGARKTPSRTRYAAWICSSHRLWTCNTRVQFPAPPRIPSLWHSSHRIAVDGIWNKTCHGSTRIRCLGRPGHSSGPFRTAASLSAWPFAQHWLTYNSATEAEAIACMFCQYVQLSMDLGEFAPKFI